MRGDNSEKRGPGRPRSEATHDAIVDAALELIEEEDYRSISIEQIAGRAKVGKQSIYRWWPSKADLLLEALLIRSQSRLPPYLPSDDAFADLREFLRRFLLVLCKPIVRNALRGLLAEALLDGEFAAKFAHDYLALRKARILEILQHGAALGQIRQDADLETAADLAIAAVMMRLAGVAHAGDDDFAASLIEIERLALAPARA